MSITADELNFLVYAYLHESGFSHSAWVFAVESRVAKSPAASLQIPPGALVNIVRKGLRYNELELELEPSTSTSSSTSTSTTTRLKRSNLSGPSDRERKEEVSETENGKGEGMNGNSSQARDRNRSQSSTATGRNQSVSRRRGSNLNSTMNSSTTYSDTYAGSSLNSSGKITERKGSGIKELAHLGSGWSSSNSWKEPMEDGYHRMEEDNKEEEEEEEGEGGGEGDGDGEGEGEQGEIVDINSGVNLDSSRREGSNYAQNMSETDGFFENQAQGNVQDVEQDASGDGGDRNKAANVDKKTFAADSSATTEESKQGERKDDESDVAAQSAMPPNTTTQTDNQDESSSNTNNGSNHGNKRKRNEAEGEKHDQNQNSAREDEVLSGFIPTKTVTPTGTGRLTTGEVLEAVKNNGEAYQQGKEAEGEAGGAEEGEGELEDDSYEYEEDTENNVEVLKGHDVDVYACGWNPKFNILASGSVDATARLWWLTPDSDLDSHSGSGSDSVPKSEPKSVPKSISTTTSNASSLRFGKHGKCLILKHVDAASKEKKDVTSIAWRPDGNWIATACYDGKARIWNLSGQLVKTLSEHEGPLFAVSWSQSGNYLATGSMDNSVIIWDFAQTVTEEESLWGAAISERIRDFNRLSHEIKNNQDEIPAATANKSSSYIRDRDIPDDHGIHGSVASSSSLIKVDDDMDIDTGRISNRDNTQELHTTDPPDSSLVLPATGAHTSLADSSASLHSFNHHKGQVLDVAWRDDEYLATASGDATVTLCRVGSPRMLLQFDGHSKEVNSVKFSPCGRWLASCSDDWTVKVWDVDQALRYIENNPIGPEDDVPKISPTFDFCDHAAEVYAISFSPTGPGTQFPDLPLRLGSASFDSTVMIWDLTTGQSIFTFHGHQAEIYSLSFSPDGKYIASGSSDSVLKAWAVEDGTVIHSSKGEGGIFEVSWKQHLHRNALSLAASCSDGAVRVVHLSV